MWLFRSWLTSCLGLTIEIILLIDSPSDLPSKSIYMCEHLDGDTRFHEFLFSKYSNHYLRLPYLISTVRFSTTHFVGTLKRSSKETIHKPSFSHTNLPNSLITWTSQGHTISNRNHLYVWCSSIRLLVSKEHSLIKQSIIQLKYNFNASI